MTTSTLLLLALLDPRGDLTHFGNQWGWSAGEEGFVPQLVMYATPPHFYANPAKIDRDIETFLAGHGFNGFHIFVSCRWFDIEEEDCRRIEGRDPDLDPRVFDALELLIRKTHQAGGMVHLWMWGDEQRGQTPSARPDWGGLAGAVARKVEREIARRLGPLPGWSLGYGFDLDEWVEVDQMRRFRDRLQKLLPRFRFLGGRPGGPNHGVDHREYGAWNRALDYASYEHHRPDYAVYVAALQANPQKPVLSEDRFRVMSGSNPKHYTLSDVRRGLWHSTLAGGVGNIWGYLLDGGSHDLGSATFPNREAIQTHFEFIRRRFSRGMTRCSPEGSRPSQTPLCLGQGSRRLLYKEDASSVELPLDALARPEPAVAVDTLVSYREVGVGPLEPGTAVWVAPYESDWALAVGDFERPPSPFPPSTSTGAPSGLRVASFASGRLELSWLSSAEPERTFELERAEGGSRVPGDFRRRTTVPEGENRVVDEGVLSPRTYWYRLRAIDSGGYLYSESLRVFVGEDGMVVSGLRPGNLDLQPLTAGDAYYLDRDYRLKAVPLLLEGALWIRTANDDKLAGEERFLSFETAGPVTVYVAFDPRARSLPHWLEDWTSVTAKVEVAGEAIRRFDLYRRDFEPGLVNLGGTSASGASWSNQGRSHYLVAILARKANDSAERIPLAPSRGSARKLGLAVSGRERSWRKRCRRR